MKTWRFHKLGSFESLKFEEVECPSPEAGEVLVKIDYAALNPADRYLIEGKYPRPGTPPFAVGRDGIGTIEVPAEGGRFAKGDRVILLRSDVGVSREGTLSQFVCIPEESLAPQPEGWTAEESAGAALVHLTAWQALVDEGELEAGQNVLVTGASGGVGTAAVVLAKALGAKNVVALSRSEAKRQQLLELGADLAFDSDDPDLVKKVRDGLGGGRCDVTVENLTGPFLQKSMDLAAYKGRICVVGLLAGLKSEIVVGYLIHKRLRIKGIAAGGFTPAEAQERWTKIVTALDSAGRRPVVDRAFPFEQLLEAFDHLKSGPMGKVLVGPMND